MWSNDIKGKYMFMFPLNNLPRKGLNKVYPNVYSFIHRNTYIYIHIYIYIYVLLSNVSWEDDPQAYSIEFLGSAFPVVLTVILPFWCITFQVYRYINACLQNSCQNAHGLFYQYVDAQICVWLLTIPLRNIWLYRRLFQFITTQDTLLLCGYLTTFRYNHSVNC